MPEATMASRGRVTLPKEVREGLGLKPGTKVMFVRVGAKDFRMVTAPPGVEAEPAQ